jgi:hypothetical protein
MLDTQGDDGGLVTFQAGWRDKANRSALDAFGQVRR